MMLTKPSVSTVRCRYTLAKVGYTNVIRSITPLNGLGATVHPWFGCRVQHEWEEGLLWGESSRGFRNTLLLWFIIASYWHVCV